MVMCGDCCNFVSISLVYPDRFVPLCQDYAPNQKGADLVKEISKILMPSKIDVNRRLIYTHVVPKEKKRERLL